MPYAILFWSHSLSPPPQSDLSLPLVCLPVFDCTWQDFALAVRVRGLPAEVLVAAEDRYADLSRRKKGFALELSKEQQTFIGTMSRLADAADDFRTHLDVEKARSTFFSTARTLFRQFCPDE